jgi:hypothetical protein
MQRRSQALMPAGSKLFQEKQPFPALKIPVIPLMQPTLLITLS